MSSRKKKRKGSDDDEEDGDDGEADVTDVKHEGKQSKKTRGTILLTLRNVPPYTLWSHSFSIMASSSN
jgi:25S rRNA (uracil2634-N3)-methyltransferase